MKKFNWHGILMLLCCLIPMVAIFYFFSGGRFNFSGLGSSASLLFLLACPLMHIVMMKFMGGSCHHQKEAPEKAKSAQE
ncbi:DUF2933 domain-containing protein [Zhaonella formicivorans]|uniref:DUF2933 domain-containing protein n=1 Tax=Zhaonella formicivorans TaxID=2528593 RepID=UPI0010EE8B84|nr:DUF2933 domain-containing protein [Zhaonella formicivorans]